MQRDVDSCDLQGLLHPGGNGLLVRMGEVVAEEGQDERREGLFDDGLYGRDGGKDKKEGLDEERKVQELGQGSGGGPRAEGPVAGAIVCDGAQDAFSVLLPTSG